LVTADSYEAAVQRVTTEGFDAVVSAPALANFSRRGFARVVQNSRLNSQSSVVLLTGSRGRGSDVPGAGRISMLPRPFHPDELVPFFKQITRAFQVERRGQRRLSFRASVHCVKGLARFQATSVNLGTTGMLLDVRTWVRLNEELELHFDLEPSGPAVATRARVTRADSPTRVGVIFQGLRAEDRQRIRTFIEQHLPGRA